MIGKKLHGFWAQAHSNLPALVERSQPKLGELTTQALGIVAGIGVNLLLFLASFIISGILMAFGESGAQATQEVFARLAGTAAGRSLPSSPPRPYARWPRESSVSPAFRPYSSVWR